MKHTCAGPPTRNPVEEQVFARGGEEQVFARGEPRVATAFGGFGAALFALVYPLPVGLPGASFVPMTSRDRVGSYCQRRALGGSLSWGVSVLTGQPTEATGLVAGFGSAVTAGVTGVRFLASGYVSHPRPPPATRRGP